MFGKSKLDITKISSMGHIKERVSQILGLHMYCNHCMKTRDGGLGGDKAASASDLCVGAMVDGWMLTTSGQYCDQCATKWGVRFILSPEDRYLEWWLRRAYPVVISVLHTAALVTFTLVVAHVLTRLTS